MMTTVANASKSEYPRSNIERKMDEMGSMVGGEGIVFRTSQFRNESTKITNVNSSINKYLWDASLEILDQAPFILKDEVSGVISTDWYSDKNDVAKKVTLRIVGNVIAPESLEVQLNTKALRKGVWFESESSVLDKLKIEEEIIRRAKEMYIKSKDSHK